MKRTEISVKSAKTSAQLTARLLPRARLTLTTASVTMDTTAIAAFAVNATTSVRNTRRKSLIASVTTASLTVGATRATSHGEEEHVDLAATNARQIAFLLNQAAAHDPSAIAAARKVTQESSTDALSVITLARPITSRREALTA